MKIPFFKQDTIYNCGPAVIKMLLKYHHQDQEYTLIQELCKTSSNGTTILGMKRCLEFLNFEVGCYQATITQIKERNEYPLIAHLSLNQLYHYVIVTKIDDKNISVIDPGSGKKNYSIEAFEKIFTGYIIYIEKLGDYKILPRKESIVTFIFKFLNHVKSLLVTMIVLSLIIGICSVLHSYYFQLFIDVYIHKNQFEFLIFTFIFLILLVLRIFLTYHQSIIYLQLEMKAKRKYIMNVYQNFIYLNHQKLQNSLAQNLNQQDEVQQLIQIIIQYVHVFFVDGLLILIIMMALAYIDIYIFMVVCFAYIGISLLFYFWYQKIDVAEKNDIKKRDEMMKVFLEYMKTIQFIKQYQYIQYIKGKVEVAFQRQLTTNFLKMKYYHQIDFMVNIMINAIIQIIIIYTYYRVQNTYMSVGQVINCYMLLNMLLPAFINVIGQVIQIPQTKLLYERYKMWLPKPKTKLKKIKKIQTIDFDYVSYGYHYGPYIIEDMNLNVSRHTLIKGDVGSGKSTLLKLLMKVDQVDQGNIYINGIDINQIDDHSLYRCIYYLDSQPIFFEASLVFNLIGYKEECYDKMIELLNYFELDQFIPLLNECGDFNQNYLSSGQKQMMMMIRALIKKPQVLILDEALSNVNLEKTNQILQYICDHYPNMILIVVSHQTNIVNIFEDCVIMSKNNKNGDRKWKSI